MHTPEIEKLRKLVAERRRKEGRQNEQLRQDKHKSSINLLSFFRGPTAKLVKAKPKAVPKPGEDVSISSVSFTPNAPPLMNHNSPAMNNMNISPQQNSRLTAVWHDLPSKIYNPNLFSPSHKILLTDTNASPQQQSPPFSKHPVLGDGRGLAPQSQQAQQMNQNHPIAKPFANGGQGPINNIIQGLRNMEKPFNQDYRKINGKKVDPTLILSQGYWSRPQKFQPKTRSISLQNTGGQDYPGKLYQTLTLPVDNGLNKPEVKWTFSRNSPTKQAGSPDPPTFRRSFLQGGGMTIDAGQQQDQYEQVPQRDQLHERENDGDQLRAQQRDQVRDQPQQHQNQQAQQQQPPSISSPYAGTNLEQPSTTDQLYIGPKTGTYQLNHQLNKNQNHPFPSPAFGQVGTERPYGSAITDRKNYVVSIRKRRDLDNQKNSTDKSEVSPITPTNNKIFDQNEIIRIVKRNIFDESRKSDEEIDQESVLESLTNEETDGDDMLNDLKKKGTDASGLRVTGSAVATAAKDSAVARPVKSDDRAKKNKGMNVEHTKDAYQSEPFKLIEKASYRPNDPDDERGKVVVLSSESNPRNLSPAAEPKKAQQSSPVVVNLPLSNGREASKTNEGNMPRPVIVQLPHKQALGKLNHKNAPQQGTSFDLLTNFNRMNTPDPRETSSYTEAHVDNPNINAVASAKIYHGDDAQSTGRTSTNIEITGVGDNQAPAGQEQTGKPVVESPPLNTQPEQNASDLGTEEQKGVEIPQEIAGSDVNGERFYIRICLCMNIASLPFVKSNVIVLSCSTFGVK